MQRWKSELEFSKSHFKSLTFMKKSFLIFFFLFGIFCPSCHQMSKKYASEKKDSVISNKSVLLINPDNETKEHLKQLSQKLLLDSGSINFTDKGSFWLLYFHSGKVVFDFNPSCGYSFPAYIVGDKILFNWAKDMNCNFDRGLNSKFGGTRSPEINKPFGEIKLLNDSTLFIKYYYEEWVKRINESEKRTIDTLFPTCFTTVRL
jgi:thiol-disulfide isomerase/thioredoxin